MASTVQDYANHRRYFPMWHFFAAPVLLANIFVQARHLFREVNSDSLWNVVVALALAVAVFASRVMALKAQNRAIRVEERGRMAEFLPEDLRNRSQDLTTGQIVALRFASDEELGGLTRRCLDGELRTGNEIKASIKNWRPDHHRV